MVTLLAFDTAICGKIGRGTVSAGTDQTSNKPGKIDRTESALNPMHSEPSARCSDSGATGTARPGCPLIERRGDDRMGSPRTHRAQRVRGRRPTARWLAPQATHYIQTLTPDEAQALPLDLREALNTLILEWGKYDEKECGKVQGTKTSCQKINLHWESASTPRAAYDPDRVPAMQIPRSINEEGFDKQEV